MPVSTIAGTAVKFLTFSRGEDETGGKRQRTLSGQRRGDVLWTARVWQGSVYCTDDTEANALRVLADDLTARTCAGDLFPAGGVSCHVQCTGDTWERTRNGWYRVLSLTMREVTP